MRFVILILLVGLTGWGGGQTLRVADVIQNAEHRMENGHRFPRKNSMSCFHRSYVSLQGLWLLTGV